MAEYNAYGDLYDQRPELLIHERLRHSGTVREIINLASEQNFNVSLGKGPFRQYLIIKWNNIPTQKSEAHSVASGLRYFRRLNTR